MRCSATAPVGGSRDAAMPGVRSRREAGNILVMTGSQQGLDLLSKWLVDPGDASLVDRPCYLGPSRRSGPRAPSWSAGTCDAATSASSKICCCATPKMTTPIRHFQNPTGHTLGLNDRRERQLGPVSRSDHRGRHLSRSYLDAPPRRRSGSFDEYKVVIYLSTFSKTLAPDFAGMDAASEVIVDQLSLRSRIPTPTRRT